MRRLLPLLILIGAAGPARAGEIACHLDDTGVLVAPARVGDEAGDFMIDTGQLHSQMHETRAQTAGIAAPSVTAPVRIAGLTLPPTTFEVADLDTRAWAFPTPVAGVIGLDALSGLVIDLRLSPCRLGLYRPGRAPRLRGLAAAPLRVGKDGRLLTIIGVSDGASARRGEAVLATGADAGLRLSDSVASAPAAADPKRLEPYGRRFGRLRAVSLWGELTEFPAVGLVAEGEVPTDGLGVIGPEALDGFRIRLDLARGRLWVAVDTKKAPASPPGP